MRFDASQHMKLGQQMKLAPRMIQSMEILALPLAELEERIEQELESNPTLEVDESSGSDEVDDRADGENSTESADDGVADDSASDEKSGDQVGDDDSASDDGAARSAAPEDGALDAGEAADDFARLDSFEEEQGEFAGNSFESGQSDRGFEDGSGPSRVSSAGERDGKMDAMASTPSRAVSLSDQLLDQWHLAEVDPEVREAGDLLIQFIEEDGYLRTALETIASRAPEGRRPSVELLERALGALQQSLEPAGIGARDRRECLLLQIDAQRRAAAVREPALEHARLLIEGHLEDLAQNKVPRIVERTGLSVEEVSAAKARMKGLSLAPGRGLVSESSASIRPDVVVEYDEERDRYVAYLAETRWSSLQVNREYALMARDRAVPEKDREFIRKNLSNAQWLIEAVAQRRSTLLRVVERVIEHQREVLDYGWQALKPLPMTQVAEELGIHVATVSRAVSEKHLLTPRGVIPLRRLFTGGLATEGGGEVSADAVKAALEELIAQEDKSSPLSDDALADALKKRGIEIARRTVAKYRDQLGIQPARLRKAF